MKKNVLLFLVLCHFGLFAQSNTKTNVKPKPKTATKTGVKKTTPKAAYSNNTIVKDEVAPLPTEPTQIFNTGIIFHSPYELTDANLITKEVVTYGKVVQVSPWKTYDGKQMYFINLEQKFPHNLVTVMAFKDSYESDYDKIKELFGKTILVSGKVEINERYKTDNVALKPSITIYSRKQIRIISDF